MNADQLEMIKRPQGDVVGVNVMGAEIEAIHLQPPHLSIAKDTSARDSGLMQPHPKAELLQGHPRKQSKQSIKNCPHRRVSFLSCNTKRWEAKDEPQDNQNGRDLDTRPIRFQWWSRRVDSQVEAFRCPALCC